MGQEVESVWFMVWSFLFTKGTAKHSLVAVSDGDLRFEVSDSRFRVVNFGCRVRGCRGSVFEVWSLGFGVDI